MSGVPPTVLTGSETPLTLTASSAALAAGLTVAVECSAGSASDAVFLPGAASVQFVYTAPLGPLASVSCALVYASGDVRYTEVVTAFSLAVALPTLAVNGVPTALLTGSVTTLTVVGSAQVIGLPGLQLSVSCVNGTATLAHFDALSFTGTFEYTAPLTADPTDIARWFGRAAMRATRK